MGLFQSKEGGAPEHAAPATAEELRAPTAVRRAPVGCFGAAQNKAAAPKEAQSKKRARPRRPLDCDDDEAVERYLGRVRDYERAAADAVVAKRRGGMTEDEILDDVLLSVEKVVENLKRGDCCMKVSSAALFIPSPNLRKSECAVVLLFPDFRARGQPYADDARLLASVGDDVCGDVDLISPLRGVGGGTMDKAVPFLVDAVVARGLAKLQDISRLRRRWAAYLRGIPWHRCDLSEIHRPSLGSWCGYPWETAHVAEHCGCGLLSRLDDSEAAGINVRVAWVKGIEKIPPKMEGRVASIWDKRLEDFDLTKAFAFALWGATSFAAATDRQKFAAAAAKKARTA